MFCFELVADIGRTKYVLRKKKESFLIVHKEPHVTIGKSKHVKVNTQSNLQDNSNHELRVINFLMERELIVYYLLVLFYLYIIKTD